MTGPSGAHPSGRPPTCMQTSAMTDPVGWACDASWCKRCRALGRHLSRPRYDCQNVQASPSFQAVQVSVVYPCCCTYVVEHQCACPFLLRHGRVKVHHPAHYQSQMLNIRAKITSRAAAADAVPIESDEAWVQPLLSGSFGTLPHTKAHTTTHFVSGIGWKSVGRQAEGIWRSVTKTHLIMP